MSILSQEFGIQSQIIKFPLKTPNGSISMEVMVIFCAASILGNSDALKNGFLVLSPLKNYDILRVFYSRSWIAKYVYLHNDNLSQAIRDQLILPYWRYHKFDISAFYGVNLPKNAIMTPLLTDNLSLAKLWAKGKISFTDAIECMLNAGIDTKPILPKYFNDSDFAKVKSILAGTHCKPKKSVLYNPVNHSNDSITFSDLNELKKMLVSNNISLTFNASQADSSYKSFKFNITNNRNSRTYTSIGSVKI